jgi:predicted O-methyltransferase YrrM
MMNKLKHLLRYLKYLKKAKTKFGIHSPFVFDFITNVIEDKTIYQDYNDIEDRRAKLLRNKNIIETVDFGAYAGKGGYHTSLQRIQAIAKKSAISSKQGQLLYRIVKYLQPDYMLELGTSLGISSIYQVAPLQHPFFIGIEGCASTAAIAEENLARFSHNSNYSLVIGNFNVVLPEVLQKLTKLDYAFIDGNHAYKPTMEYFNMLLPLTQENTLLIFHDIYWSQGMERAWNDIKQNPQVTITIDLFHMGLVFFRKGMPKQDFIIRF